MNWLREEFEAARREVEKWPPDNLPRCDWVCPDYQCPNYDKNARVTCTEKKCLNPINRTKWL